MSRTMVRGVMAGALALAAGVLDRGSATAEAAPSVNEFAGSYTGALPSSEAGFNYGWKIEISSRGAVRGSTRFGYPTPYPPSYSGTARGSLRGVVSADGAMSLDGEIRGDGFTSTFDFTATAVLDAAGNLVGTTASGDTFTWTRK